MCHRLERTRLVDCWWNFLLDTRRVTLLKRVFRGAVRTLVSKLTGSLTNRLCHRLGDFENIKLKTLTNWIRIWRMLKMEKLKQPNHAIETLFETSRNI